MQEKGRGDEFHSRVVIFAVRVHYSLMLDDVYVDIHIDFIFALGE